jgi:hypothetical protein
MMTLIKLIFGFLAELFRSRAVLETETRASAADHCAAPG